MKEKKLRIEDALSATKAASQEGVVAGGGVALLKAKDALNQEIEKLNGDEKTGAKIVLNALESPIKQIATNCGVDANSVLKTIYASKDVNFGYDALNDKFVDMIECGIIDPTKVTRSALQNACSVAGTLLTTECLVADIPEKQSNADNNQMMY